MSHIPAMLRRAATERKVSPLLLLEAADEFEAINSALANYLLTGSGDLSDAYLRARKAEKLAALADESRKLEVSILKDECQRLRRLLESHGIDHGEPLKGGDAQ